MIQQADTQEVNGAGRAEQRRLWCGDCRATTVFEQVQSSELPGVHTEAEGVELLCTACGAAYFADFCTATDLPTVTGGSRPSMAS